MSKLSEKLGVSETPRLVVCEYKKTLKDWCREMNISKELEASIFNSQLVIIPEGYKNYPKAFAIHASDFYNYCKQNKLLDVEICCEDADFTQIELCSFKIRLGKFIAPSTIAGTIIWNVFSAYIKDTFDSISKSEILMEQVSDVPAFQSEPECSFSVIIKDTTGKYMEIQYDGPISGMEVAGDQIKKIASNENKAQ